MDHPYSVPGLSDLANPLAPTARATSNLEVALTENRSAVALRLHVIQKRRRYSGDLRALALAGEAAIEAPGGRRGRVSLSSTGRG